MRKLLLGFVAVGTLAINSCNKGDGEGFNLFSIQDDKNLGIQVKNEIAANPNDYPVISRSANPAAYAYLDAMRDDILNSGEVTHKEDFEWEMFIIKDDNMQNAFCTPGGYIYVYTGLIKYLDDKSSLAGVLGHEMAHADKRHSTEMLTKAYGIQTLLSVALGNDQGTLTQVVGSLINLSFSRGNETEADKYSVIYLCPTKYHADGAANFFQKLEAAGGANPPEFLSTHPNPDNRIQNIRNEATTRGCVSEITSTENITTYTQFKNSL